MSLFKYINIIAFIISLAFGLFAVYITIPENRKIIVYPTHDNYDVIQYRDKADTCFSFREENIQCPKDEKEISKVPMQS
jgi:hypothetical protein